MIYHGDLFDVLPTLPAESIDACVTDPPYGIGFMGREWDTFKPGTGKTRKLMHPREREAAKIVSDNPNINGRHRSPALSPSQIDYDYSVAGLRAFQEWTERWAHEVFRVLKPGAYLVVCCAPRSYHRMACGLEDAGFVIRDKFSYLFGSGFPKSLNFGCKCGGNAIQYNHASPSYHSVRGVRQGSDDATGVVAPHEAPDLFTPLQRDSSEHRTGEALAQGPSGLDGCGRSVLPGKDVRREQPGVEGRELHRAGEGLPDDPDAESSESAGERLCARAPDRRGEDPRPTAQGERGSASPGSGPSEQRPGKSANLRLPSRTLDGRAPDRRSRCERCGGLTAARGLGTALKPAHEPIALAWKPFRGSIADTWVQHGTAALNIDACRVNTGEQPKGYPNGPGGKSHHYSSDKRSAEVRPNQWNPSDEGRWPSNVLLDEEAAALLDEQTGDLGVSAGGRIGNAGGGSVQNVPVGRFAAGNPGYGDSGGASRFYYVAKPSREERDYGCHAEARRSAGECTGRADGSAGLASPRAGAGRTGGARNFHPTVKPVELMRWLVRLVTPTGGTVLDPFMGSGTTGMACRYELRPFIGIEKEADYIQIAERRIAAVAPLFGEATA